jgi:hypothetical protein
MLLQGSDPYRHQQQQQQAGGVELSLWLVEEGCHGRIAMAMACQDD